MHRDRQKINRLKMASLAVHVTLPWVSLDTYASAASRGSRGEMPSSHADDRMA